jgi:C-terminal processing protease CtpA/Prc
MRLPADSPRFGLEFKRFGNEYRLVGALSDLKVAPALGARLIAVNGKPVGMVHRALLKLTAQDERLPLRELRAEPMLTNGLILHGLGVTKDRNGAAYTLMDDRGHKSTIVTTTSGNMARLAWTRVRRSPDDGQATSNSGLRCNIEAGRPIAYCDFHSYENLRDGAERLFATLHNSNARRLIIDMRHNNGGDFCDGLKYLVEPLAHETEINRPGGLFVLIGPQTFSAAMSNSAHFRQITRAILVGEPIGEKPDSYQEIRDLNLPKTGWTARYSTQFYRFTFGGKNLIRPDVPIEESWEDYKHGSDPVLAYALSAPFETAQSSTTRAIIPPAESESCHQQ